VDSLLKTLRDEEELDTAVTGEATVLYKHSDRCFTCRRSLRQMERFAESRPDVPAYIIDVIGQRALSSRIAEKFGVPHESPQAILMQNGSPVWNGSHFGVTAAALERELDRLAEMD
jgi:bacillithiol system protein YtxJ